MRLVLTMDPVTGATMEPVTGAEPRATIVILFTVNRLQYLQMDDALRRQLIMVTLRCGMHRPELTLRHSNTPVALFTGIPRRWPTRIWKRPRGDIGVGHCYWRTCPNCERAQSPDHQFVCVTIQAGVRLVRQDSASVGHCNVGMHAHVRV